MKKLLIFFLLSSAAFACKQAPKNTEAASQDDPNLVAITAVIHGFYTWYDAFQQDSTKRIDFTDASGQHLKLIPSKLDTYLAHFKNSGFVSDEFIENEKTFYKSCEKFWQDELVGDVPTGMDADKYYCAQDWEVESWTTSPVGFEPIDEYKAKATMYLKIGDSEDERHFELVKKNGKWLLSKIECDMLPE